MKTVLFVMLACILANPAFAKRDSTYTFVEYGKCKDLSYAHPTEEFHVGLWRCAGKAGFSVFVGLDEGYQWISLSKDGTNGFDLDELSFLNDYVNKKAGEWVAGKFLPAGVLEWRGEVVKGAVKPDSLIFRIGSSEDRMTEATFENLLAVVKLGAKPCIVATVDAKKNKNANTIARVLADNAASMMCQKDAKVTSIK